MLKLAPPLVGKKYYSLWMLVTCGVHHAYGMILHLAAGPAFTNIDERLRWRYEHQQFS